jgi:iduronate 2-sulfatase
MRVILTFMDCYQRLGVLVVALICIGNSTFGADCFDVFIVAGQSNMDGRGNRKELTGENSRLAATQPDVQIYYANPITSPDPKKPRFNSGWTVLAPGFAIPPKYTNTLPSEYFGPELSFGRQFADDHPSRHLALIKVTQGNTSLSKDWNPIGNYLYVTLTNTVVVAVHELKKQGVDCKIRGVIWHQGESDVKGGGEKYEKNLAFFIASLRRDLGLPELPFVIGEIATNKEASFRAVQRKVAEDTRYTAFVSADGLETMEGTHFKAMSVVELGRRYAVAVEKIMSGLDEAKDSAQDEPAHQRQQSSPSILAAHLKITL